MFKKILTSLVSRTTILYNWALPYIIKLPYITRLYNWLLPYMTTVYDCLLPHATRYYKWWGRFLRRRWKKFNIVLNTPPKFMKWIFYTLILLKIRPTPRRILRFIRWCTIRYFSFIRSSMNIMFTLNWDHPYFTFYWVINFITFFFLKFYQEIVYNFSCPLATLLYGKFVRRERPHLKKPQHVVSHNLSPFKDKTQRALDLAKKKERYEEKAEVQRKKVKKWRKAQKKWKDAYILKKKQLRKLKQTNRKKKNV